MDLQAMKEALERIVGTATSESLASLEEQRTLDVATFRDQVSRDHPNLRDTSIVELAVACYRQGWGAGGLATAREYERRVKGQS